MVKLDKQYTFEGLEGKVTMTDLFNGRKQLIIYHFMLAPDSEKGCVGCSFLADQLPTKLGHLNSRDTTLVVVSRAPIDRITKFKKRMGWTFPWVSSFDSDFNYDFQASIDPDIATPVFNFKELDPKHPKGERPGLSVFLKEEDQVFHTYSAYSRGLEGLLVTHALLDFTPLGRQDTEGRPMQWKLHDEYEVDDAKPASCQCEQGAQQTL
jgi:predicted dithiol-disulfide oxidoreductase (DUF899 family)